MLRASLFINTSPSVQIGFQSCETLESLRKLQHLRQQQGAKNDKDSGYEEDDETVAEEDSDRLNEEERLFGRLQVTHCIVVNQLTTDISRIRGGDSIAFNFLVHFSVHFSVQFSGHYLKVINAIPPRRRSLYICF